MKHTLVAITMMIVSLSCKTQKKEETNSTNQKEEQMEVSNKEKAVAVLNSLETGDQSAIGYINPKKYIQHNLAVADGLEGFGAVMQNAPEGGFKAKVVRAFEDDDYVFTHTMYDFFGSKIGFDVFKFEDGKIVEHWDNLIPTAPANPSGRTQTDGRTEATDLDKTDANKQLVRDFVATILVKGEMDKVGNFIDGADDAYLQHNPAVADGLSGLGKAMEGMAKQGISMVYTTTHKILGEGDFVLTISEGTLGGTPTSYYDLFRVADGKIVEHWDVIESILPEGDRKNTNGKFNF